MRKISFILPLLFAPLVSSCACVYNNGISEKTDYSIESVSLNVDSLDLKIGNEKTQLIAFVEGTGEFSDLVSISVKDEKLVELSSLEVKSNEPFYIAGLLEGETTLTATAKGDTSKKATISVKVSQATPVIPVEGVTLDYEAESLYIGETLQLTATVLPLDATNQLVRWESSDGEVASVDQDGLVTAKDFGVAVIKVSTVEGDFSDECIISVTQELEIGGYYLCGTPNEWTPDGLYQLSKNTQAESDQEYMIKFAAESGDEFKVAKLNEDISLTWFNMAYSGSGVASKIQDSIELNYGETGNIHVIKSGEYTLYFDLNQNDGTNYKYWINPGFAS